MAHAGRSLIKASGVRPGTVLPGISFYLPMGRISLGVRGCRLRAAPGPHARAEPGVMRSRAGRRTLKRAAKKDMERKLRMAGAELKNGGALALAGKIVCSFVSQNKLGRDEIPALLEEVYVMVTSLADGDVSRAGPRAPAVPVEKSVTPDYIVCLEDGKKLKMLKRYLRTRFDLSPEEYRRRWGLPADYPMTAPNYAKSRSQLAKDIGLGTAAMTTKRRKPARRKTPARRRASA